MTAVGAMTAELAAAAATLRGLHVPGRPLVLANIWDAASARLAEAAGFPVVATSSGAVAESLGYADHQNAPVDDMLAAATRIVRAVAVPVTVDAEAGYGLTADDLVRRLLAAGAVGANLEDSDHGTGGLTDVAAQADWLASVRAAADRSGVPLVVNARVDVFIRAQGTDEHTLLADAVARARAYLAAGADCVYPIGLRDQDVLRRLVAEVAPAPVNVMTVPGGPPVAGLAELGVARVSMGTSVWRAAQQALARRFTELAVY
jgi:2-methylisocitrate lyase-like PEP mutase family enzyme